MNYKRQVEPIIISKNATTYGEKSRPRTSEPSMYQILNWRGDAFEETKNSFTNAQRAEKLKHIQANDEHNPELHYMSETHYKFKPYVVEGQEQIPVRKDIESSKEIVLCLQEGDNEPVYLKFESQAAIDDFLSQMGKKHRDEVKHEDIEKKGRPIDTYQSQKDKRKGQQSLDMRHKQSADFKNSNKSTIVKEPVFSSNPSKDEVARIKKFNEQTRWLPNSAFQTFYGKPAFENYGMGNTHPIWGGLGYGDYLKSFNINPQRGDNNPAYEQVFRTTALASYKIDYDKDHMPRKCKDEYRLSDEAVERQKSRLKLMPEKKEVIKLGRLDKPDLTQTTMFRSKPDDVRYVDSEEKENQVIEEIKQLKTTNKRVQATKVVGKREDIMKSDNNKPINYNRVMAERVNERLADKMNRSVYNPDKYADSRSQGMEAISYPSKVVKFVRI